MSRDRHEPGLPGRAGCTGAAEPGAASEASGRPAASDIAALKLLAAAELVGSDLWLQYGELARSNRNFRAALFDLDAVFRQSLEGITGFSSSDGRSKNPNLTDGRRGSRRVMPRPCEFLRHHLPH